MEAGGVEPPSKKVRDEEPTYVSASFVSIATLDPAKKQLPSPVSFRLGAPDRDLTLIPNYDARTKAIGLTLGSGYF